MMLIEVWDLHEQVHVDYRPFMKYDSRYLIFVDGSLWKNT